MRYQASTPVQLSLYYSQMLHNVGWQLVTEISDKISETSGRIKLLEDWGNEWTRKWVTV
jgi:hypothetical protein